MTPGDFLPNVIISLAIKADPRQREAYLLSTQAPRAVTRACQHLQDFNSICRCFWRSAISTSWIYRIIIRRKPLITSTIRYISCIHLCALLKAKVLQGFREARSILILPGEAAAVRPVHCRDLWEHFVPTLAIYINTELIGSMDGHRNQYSYGHTIQEIVYNNIYYIFRNKLAECNVTHSCKKSLKASY